MPEMKNLPEEELLLQYPEFDIAWGALHDLLSQMSFRLNLTGLFAPSVHADMDKMFDAMLAILHHYDVTAEAVQETTTEGENQ